jgi:type II secretion system protein C
MDTKMKMKAYKGAMRPSFIIVTLVIVSTILYLSFKTTPSTLGSSVSKPIQLPNSGLPSKLEDKNTQATSDDQKTISENTSFDFDSLDLTLLATIVANPINLSSAVIQSKTSVETYNLSDKIKQTDVAIAAIYHNYVVLVMDNQEYELRLSAKADKNVRHTAHQQVDAEQLARDKKRAKQIGNRPKELEHIVIITPASDGYYVGPGINPALFRAARFKEGDVLQTINGKDVNIPEELEQAKALISTAETLAFNVLRRGVLITLYLDIPAENLSITQ